MRSDRAAKSPGKMRDVRKPAMTMLRDEDLRAVAGGRKAGKGQMEFYQVTMTDLLVSGFTPTPPGS